jgi:hypothetical protein|tara:strand:+ start:289 stop:399 length:111 start_codon:yes stop_codon:yes gene_type:complete
MSGVMMHRQSDKLDAHAALGEFLHQAAQVIEIARQA